MSKKLSLNSRITKYFLENTRLTILALITLIVFGVGSLLSLKTTGFPSPSLNTLIVRTIYPGASANTILEEITKPLEANIKKVDGVKTYTTNSADNYSIIQVTLKEGTNIDAAKLRVESAAKSVEIPTNAQTPEVSSIDIRTDEYYFSLLRKNSEVNYKEDYEVLNIIKTEIEKDSDVEAVNFGNEIVKKVVISPNFSLLNEYKISTGDIANSLRLLEINIPVSDKVELDNKIYNISLSLSSNGLEDIKNLQVISPQSLSAPKKLSDITDVSLQYVPKKEVVEYVGESSGEEKISVGLPFSINVSDSVDSTVYNERLEKIKETYFNQNSEGFKALPEGQKALLGRYTLLKIMSSVDDDERQVKEVVAGLIGEKWHIKGLGGFGYIGYVFGGIQLVFLLMLAIVSWRAALISALAIPLSFIFSTIVVKLTGNDLNTLVLFSLVLVIGLVVDPALVVLESIQRNKDNGFKGKEAVVKSIEEIGSGLFLAVMTSILVFIPFGIVSGFFGEIISYIPLTIIPALIGSYIVPLVFLSWFGGLFLKRKKNTSDNEEENLWKSAQWMISFNKKILHSNIFIRFAIIFLSLAIPFAIASFYTSTDRVRQVQFAQPENADMLLLKTINLPQETVQKLNEKSIKLVEVVSMNSAVEFVSPLNAFGGDGINETSYLIRLKEKSQRGGLKANQIATNIETSLNEKYKSDFFDIDASAVGIGIGESAFPISLGVKTNNILDQQSATKDITKILENICKTGEKTFEYKDECSVENRIIDKVDNGYDSKVSEFIEINLSKEALKTNPVNPIEVRTILSNLYKLNEGKEIGSFKENEEKIDIIFSEQLNGPKTIDEIKNVSLRTFDGRQIKLQDIAQINKIPSVKTITRVKGETVGVILAKPVNGFTDQKYLAQIQSLVTKKFDETYASKYKELKVGSYSEGDAEAFNKSFAELGLAFFLALLLTYIVLVVFFKSFAQPLVILFSIPLTFIGIFPALALFGGGQLGFLEIIGIIILVGLVENVAIFLIDAANQKIKEGWDAKDAIAYASGIRFRPIVLTKLTALVSTAPLAILSEQYRSLSVVIIFGLITSGIVSLFTSPILFIFFRSLSQKVRRKKAE
jgi:HAE1 family hydrophobic/amphiphilic exporter-1